MAETPYQIYQRFLNDPSGSVGFSPRSRLGSAIDRGTRFVRENIPAIAQAQHDLRPLNLATDLAQRGVKYLTDPQPDGLTQEPQSKPQPDFDSRPPFDAMAGTGIGPRGTVPNAPLDPNGGMRQFEDRFGPHEGIFFKDSPRTSGDDLAIERMRSQSHVRPLLQTSGDNGGPLSLADMEANSRAMNALDDYYTNAPQEQRVRELEGQGAERQAEMLAEDPFAVERGRAGIDFEKLIGLEHARGQIAQGREFERRAAHQQAMSQIDTDEAEAIEAANRIPDEAKRQAAVDQIATRANRDRQQLQAALGLGAGLSTSTLYRTDGL